jgi:hypothetical protein
LFGKESFPLSISLPFLAAYFIGKRPLADEIDAKFARAPMAPFVLLLRHPMPVAFIDALNTLYAAALDSNQQEIKNQIVLKMHMLLSI